MAFLIEMLEAERNLALWLPTLNALISQSRILSEAQMRKIKCWLARTRVRYVLVMFIFCVVLVAQTLQPMADYLAGVLFKHLDTPADGEYPSTYAHFPASPIVAGIIGGKGEGLSCSIPRLARLLFKNTSDSGPVELQFRQACNMHDFCYRHGYSTYGYNQADCDYQL